jgi:Ca2+-binding EF-hand superfamily protein
VKYFPLEDVMKYPIVLLCSAALLSTAALAGEEKSKEGANATFETLDADADGKLSRDEVSGNSSLSGNFAALDGNSDGFVSKREFQRNTMPKPRSSY